MRATDRRQNPILPLSRSTHSLFPSIRSIPLSDAHRRQYNPTSYVRCCLPKAQMSSYNAPMPSLLLFPMSTLSCMGVYTTDSRAVLAETAPHSAPCASCRQSKVGNSSHLTIFDVRQSIPSILLLTGIVSISI